MGKLSLRPPPSWRFPASSSRTSAAPGADPVVSTARLGLTNAAAGLVAALLFPLLGAAADRGRSRKRFLLFFMGLGALTTACLSLVQAGHWPLAAILYGLSLLGFSGGNVFTTPCFPLSPAAGTWTACRPSDTPWATWEAGSSWPSTSG